MGLYCGKLLNNSAKKRLVFVIFAAALIAAAILTISGCGATDDVDLAAIKGGETRATMSPANFTGKAALAYKAAKEIPEVLDHMHCYCECKKHKGHKSLLTCFVDRHGVNCSICIEEAVMAKRLHDKGEDIASIREAIDKRFSRR